MIFNSFEYEFEELEIYPGVYAYGIADLVLFGGKFVLTGLWTGNCPKSKGMTVRGSDDPIWKLIEAALLKTPEYLMDAYERDQERQREANREAERAYAYED